MMLPDPSTPHAARQLVAAFAADTFRPALVDRVVLLTSEIVTNALLHAKAPYVLDAQLAGDGLTVGVHDASPIPPVPRLRSQRAESEIGGWGLLLVHEMADAWGSRPTPDGKIVWFRIDSPAVNVTSD